MSDVIRLVCPACDRSRSKRISELNECIANWVYDKDFRELLACFDISIPRSGSLQEHIEKLWEAIQIWDFRKGQERWHIRTDDSRIYENRSLIEAVAEKLGLLSITETVIPDPDYLCPLGGARMTNYNTPLKARSLIDAHDWEGVAVVGLSAERPTTDRDRPFYEQYAPGAASEFMAMCGGLEKAFSLSGGHTVLREENENAYLCAEKRVYDQKYREGMIASVSAPSSEPAIRRANTLDTFLYCIKAFDVEENSRLIFTTSCIYVPFQLMKLMTVALEKNLMIDCVGSERRDHIPSGEHSKYLQELKATVDAIHSLMRI